MPLFRQFAKARWLYESSANLGHTVSNYTETIGTNWKTFLGKQSCIIILGNSGNMLGSVSRSEIKVRLTGR